MTISINCKMIITGNLTVLKLTRLSQELLSFHFEHNITCKKPFCLYLARIGGMHNAINHIHETCK